MTRQRGWGCAAGLWVGLVMHLGPAIRPAPAAPPAADEFDDRWLSVMATEELATAAGADLKVPDWASLEKRAQTLLLQRLACGHLDKMAALNDWVYVLRAAQFLPIADKLDPTHSQKFSAWLLANRDVSRLLFRAMQDVASPQDALGKFQSLLAWDDKVGSRVLAYANLAIAFATSEPLIHYAKQPNPASMLESFAWFTNPKMTFRYDLKAMPYELSRYLADTRLSLAERQWAVGRYANRANLPGAYFDVQFDMDYYFRGTPKKITRTAYTLPNIAKVGGVCIDQAYYTSEICKTLGAPSTIVRGHTGTGSGHAWVACLKILQAGGRMTVEWDASTGRYAGMKFYTGMVLDPTAQKKIHDSELILLGAAALLPLPRREEADAATTLAAMAALVAGQSGSRANSKSSPASAPDMDDLRKLAEDYNATLAAKNKIPKPNLAQLQAVRKIDSGLVEALLVQAATDNLAHRPVWDLVIELRKNGGLSTECLARLIDFLVTRTAADYPDYSCRMVAQIAPTFDDPVQRDTIYLRALDVYRKRPDLQGQLMIARGDDLAGQGKKDQALKVYEQAMTAKTRDLTEVLVLAARHAEELLLAANRRDAAIKMYAQLFAEQGKPDLDGGYPQSAFYLLGKRLAELLTESGQKDAAKKVYDKIGNGFEPALDS